jgi:hypothetical protein
VSFFRRRRSCSEVMDFITNFEDGPAALRASFNASASDELVNLGMW